MLGVMATLEGACMPVDYVLLAPGKVHRELRWLDVVQVWDAARQHGVGNRGAGGVPLVRGVLMFQCEGMSMRDYSRPSDPLLR